MEEDTALAESVMLHEGIVVGKVAFLEDKMFERVWYMFVLNCSIYIYKLAILFQIGLI
jgi:hypothetical protein